jgi:nucleoside-triphosphatase THEP1
MALAFVKTTERGLTDRLLWEFADRLQARGLHLAGVVQTNSDRPGSHHCDMDVRVLPGGPVIRINQVLGEESRGCRLNPAALEEAVALVETALERSPDLLIINKFGKHEAEGRGFRPLIAEALARDIPVLLGVNSLNQDAFEDFSGGYAEEINADAISLAAWFSNVQQLAA